jgi:nucleotide-binding universal stress UspA family protein
MKLLIAVDGSEFSDAALDEVVSRELPKGSEILVVHACEVPLASGTEVWALPTDYYERLDEVCLQNADQIIRAAVKKLAPLSDVATIKSKVVQGMPKSVILAEAEKWQPDLIVVGSHGDPKWERFLLGSVSQAVVAQAKCSVEVVRLPDRKKAAA